MPDDALRAAARAAATASVTETVAVELSLNGEPTTAEVPTSMTALQFLRERAGLVGVRTSCERAVCGACTVLVDAEPVAACAVFAWDLDGTHVETIEGWSRDGELSPEQ